MKIGQFLAILEQFELFGWLLKESQQILRSDVIFQRLPIFDQEINISYQVSYMVGKLLLRAFRWYNWIFSIFIELGEIREFVTRTKLKNHHSHQGRKTGGSRYSPITPKVFDLQKSYLYPQKLECLSFPTVVVTSMCVYWFKHETRFFFVVFLGHPLFLEVSMKNFSVGLTKFREGVFFLASWPFESCASCPLGYMYLMVKRARPNGCLSRYR